MVSSHKPTFFGFDNRLPLVIAIQLTILQCNKRRYPFDDPAAIAELSTQPMLSWGDMGALILSVFLLILFAFTGKRLARWEGAVMLGAYALYMAMLFDLVPTPFAGA